jgi:hypothetical protein
VSLLVSGDLSEGWTQKNRFYWGVRGGREGDLLHQEDNACYYKLQMLRHWDAWEVECQGTLCVSAGMMAVTSDCGKNAAQMMMMMTLAQ